jgi:dTDP-4-dehydrorhamnose 3,5-epimerase
MSYTFKKTDLPEVLILEPKVFEDQRGFFYESFNQREFQNITGNDTVFVQDNHSSSSKSVLRGLHYQINKPQGKLVRVSRGVVYDVAVDLRKSSPNFGKWVGVELSSENKRQLWIPAGFAHGFIVISESAEFLYKTTEYWYPEYERTLLWSDPAIGIKWPLTESPILAPKDSIGSLLTEADIF